MIAIQPPAKLTAGVEFGLTVDAEDPFGNIDRSFNGPVTVALANNPGGSKLGGTLTVPAKNGEAKFSDLTLDNPGGGYTLALASNGLTSEVTSSLS